MSSQGHVKCLKYLIDETIQYYRFSKQKSYTGVMHRINMGCEIYPREKNFWDWEADKTTTVIDQYIYEMTLYDAAEAQEMSSLVGEILRDINFNCDPYKWYEERYSVPAAEEEEKKEEEDTGWKAEDFVIGEIWADDGV